MGKSLINNKDTVKTSKNLSSLFKSNDNAAPTKIV